MTALSECCLWREVYGVSLGFGLGLALSWLAEIILPKYECIKWVVGCLAVWSWCTPDWPACAELLANTALKLSFLACARQQPPTPLSASLNLCLFTLNPAPLQVHSGAGAGAGL